MIHHVRSDYVLYTVVQKFHERNVMRYEQRRKELSRTCIQYGDTIIIVIKT